jgi:hypothetical protein
VSRRTVVTCDLCGAEQQVQPDQVPPPPWFNADFCNDCLKSARPVSEILAVIARLGGTSYVSPADIIPERTRQRKTS